MFVFKHYNVKANYVCMIIILTLMLNMNIMKCQNHNEIFHSQSLQKDQSNKSVPAVIVVVTEKISENEESCDDNSLPHNQFQTDSGSSDYESLHNEAYIKQKLEIIKWVLNRLKLVGNRNTEAEESISTSLLPNDIRIEILEACDNIEDTVSKMMDTLYQFNLIKPNFSSSLCSMKTEPGTECKIFAGFLMLTRHGYEAARRISQIMPSQQEIPFYNENNKPRYDDNEEEAALHVISKFKWEHVIVVSDNLDVIRSFNEKAARLNSPICISRNAYIKKKSTLNKQVKYEVLEDINVFSNNTDFNKNDRRHPATSDYATLGEALASVLHNRTSTKDGYKVVSFFTKSISFYTNNHSTSARNPVISDDAIDRNTSIVDETDEKELKMISAFKSTSWLFVVNGKDQDNKSGNVMKPFIKLLEDGDISGRKVYFLQKSFLKASEFMKYYTNLTSGDQDNPLPFDEYPNVIELMAKTMKLYDDIVSGQKSMNDQTKSDMAVPIYAFANQSIENCTSIQHNYLFTTQKDYQEIDNELMVRNVRKRLGHSSELLHKYTLTQLHPDLQISSPSNESEFYLKRVGNIIFDKGVEVEIDDEVITKETMFSHHLTIKSLLEGSVIESLNQACGYESSDHLCTCSNLRPHHLEGSQLATKEVWMVVSLTIASLGIIICISFFLWISCCKVTNCISYNILDGSQTLTLVLLVGIALLFCSVFPYVANHANQTVCMIRSHCVYR